jgi:hypothetical protein
VLDDTLIELDDNALVLTLLNRPASPLITPFATFSETLPFNPVGLVMVMVPDVFINPSIEVLTTVKT